MRRKSVLLLALLAAAFACNLPAPAAPESASPPTVSPARKTATVTPTLEPTAAGTATNTFPPSDVAFAIDCTALPAQRLADCESFLAVTRDVVYPIERELTGASLSQCWKEFRYVILPDDPRPGAGGISAGDVITYNQLYSIDLRYPYDTHEILHSLSTCAGALDLHAFHGMVMNAVYERLGVYAPGYYENASAENLTVILEDQLQKVKTVGGAERNATCVGILMRKVTLAYFDLGEGAIRPLYRSTIEPLQNLTPPTALQTEIWGSLAPRIDALMEKFMQEYKYDLGVPECGLTGV